MNYFLISLILSSISMTVIAILLRVLDEKGVLKKISASKKKWLWLIVILGFLFPIKPIVAQPLIELPNIKQYEYNSKESGTYENNLKKEWYHSMNDIVNTINQTIVDQQIEGGSFSTPISTEHQEKRFFILGKEVIQGIFVVWFVGTLFVLSTYFVKHIRFCKVLKRWEKPITDVFLLTCLEEVKEKLQYKKKISVVTCPFITGPALIGFIHPKILFPESFYSITDIKLVLAHEVNHAKKYDLWFTLIAGVAQAIHWFNPVVLQIKKEFLLHCELACDEAVLADEKIEVKIRYGTILLNAAKHSTNSQQKIYTLLSTQFTKSNRQIKKRLYALKEQEKGKHGILYLLIATGIVLSSGSFFQIAGATTSKSNAIYPYNSISKKVAIVYEGPDGEIYEEFHQESGLSSTIPEGFHSVTLEIDETELTYDLIEQIYQQKGLDKTKDKLAILLKNTEIALIDPDEMIPISPTTGGSAKWNIKAYIQGSDIWELNPERKDQREIYKIAGDVLLILVEQDITDRSKFEQAAKTLLAKAFQVPEELFILDLSEVE